MEAEGNNGISDSQSSSPPPGPVPYNPNILDELEEVFKTKRLEVVKPDGFLITPLHVIKSLAQEHDMPIHTEVYVVHLGGDENRQDRIFRVELLCGRARGLGQSPAKGFATQLAAIDMLEKMKYYNQLEFPPYGLPPGARIDPNIVRDLFTICKENSLDVPDIRFVRSTKPFEEQELFDCVVKVGMVETVARSDSHHMARRLACREMWDTLAKQKYPEMPVAMGSHCVGLTGLKNMGLQPLVSTKKHQWLEEFRRDDKGRYLYFQDEPDDGVEQPLVVEPPNKPNPLKTEPNNDNPTQ